MARTGERFKIVVMGDDGVGKTALILTALTNKFPAVDIPTVATGCLVRENTIDDRLCEYSFWDTIGGQEVILWKIRPIQYPDSDVFLLCFDITNRRSFENIVRDWLPEAAYFEPDVPLVLVGNKKDLRDERKTDDYEALYSSTYWEGFVREEEGEALTKDYNLFGYVECSALHASGVEEVVITAIRACRDNATSQKSRRLFHRQKKKAVDYNVRTRQWVELKTCTEPVQPQDPPDVINIEPQTSTFAEDLGKLLNNSCYADVQFFVSDKSQMSNETVDQTPDRTAPLTNHPLLAHRVVLCAASAVFHNIFMHTEASDNLNHCSIFKEIACESSDSYIFPVGSEEAVNERGIVHVNVSEWISRDSLQRVLQYLYTGSLGDFDSKDEHFIVEVKNVAETLTLPLLENMCTNVLAKQELLNPSIGSYHNEETGAKMKSLFLCKPAFSDVRFCVEGHMIYAHKAVLVARCDIMAAMFGPSFREGGDDVEIPLPDVTKGQFLALLEYLYTDHVTFDDIDPQDVLVLADRYVLPRLVTLCELRISRRIRDEIDERNDVIGKVVQFVSWSKMYNAHQLYKWCLHYIACNVEVFKSTEGFQQLDCDDKQYIAQHSWPTERHREKIREYEHAKREYDQRVEACRQSSAFEPTSRNRTGRCQLM